MSVGPFGGRETNHAGTRQVKQPKSYRECRCDHIPRFARSLHEGDQPRNRQEHKNVVRFPTERRKQHHATEQRCCCRQLVLSTDRCEYCKGEQHHRDQQCNGFDRFASLPVAWQRCLVLPLCKPCDCAAQRLIACIGKVITLFVLYGAAHKKAKYVDTVGAKQQEAKSID